MTGDQTARIVWAVLCLVLVGSSLLARRLPWSQTLKMTLGWAAIFAFVYVLFLYRDEARGVWNRITADVSGTHQNANGGTVRVPMADDGHFYVQARINGHPIDMMVDTGATVTALSPDAAQNVGVVGDGMPPVEVDTANGPMMAQPARAMRIEVGGIGQSNARVSIGGRQGGLNLLGMSFLSSLKSWKVEGRTLILEQ